MELIFVTSVNHHTHATAKTHPLVRISLLVSLVSGRRIGIHCWLRFRDWRRQEDSDACLHEPVVGASAVAAYSRSAKELERTPITISPPSCQIGLREE